MVCAAQDDASDNHDSESVEDPHAQNRPEGLVRPPLSEPISEEDQLCLPEPTFRNGTNHDMEEKYFERNWRLLLPVNPWKDPNLSTCDNAGFLEFVTGSWLTDIVIHGYRKCLEQEDLGKTPLPLQSKKCYDRFKRLYEGKISETKGNELPLARMLFSMVYRQYMVAFILVLLALTVNFVAPAYIVRGFLNFIENSDEPYYYGFQWAVAIMVIYGLRIILFSGMFHFLAKVAVELRTIFLSIVYNKILHLKNVGNKSVGQLLSLCASDAERIFECGNFGLLVIGLPYMMILSVIYLLNLLGPSSLFGIGTLCLLLPLQTILGHLTIKLRKKTVQFTDARVKMINEILSSVKLIKMYAWEEPFSSVVYGLREKERSALSRMLYLFQVNMATSFLLTSVSSVVTFICHVLLGNSLTATEAFTVVTIFNVFPICLVMLPVSVRALSEGWIAVKRLKKLLVMEEYKENENVSSTGNAVEIMQADFRWETTDEIEKTEKGKERQENGKSRKEKKEKRGASVADKDKTGAQGNDAKETEQLVSTASAEISPVLRDIDVVVKKGSLVGVCGPVGSGKSSFIEALLGQVKIIKGSLKVVNSISYVPQQAWIMSTVIRNNITFGKPYDSERYQRVCRACCLLPDFDVYESGDLTEVGERGVNLSGGQKQRISLARAVYADADLYLLDDPLSAVDSHVGRYIFQECIQGLLKGKTVVFVTHQLQYLRYCDEVLYISDGRILESGTYATLMSDDQEFASKIQKFNQEQENVETYGRSAMSKVSRHTSQVRLRKSSLSKARERTSERTLSNASLNASLIDISIAEEEELSESEEALAEKGKLVQEEDRKRGAVSGGTYMHFARYAGGFPIVIFVISFLFLYVAVQSFSQWWLSLWIRAMKGQRKPNIVAVNSTLTNSTNATANSIDSVLDDTTRLYMSVYGSTALGLFFMVVLSAFIVVRVLLRANTRVHNTLLKAVMQSPMSFFDQTPTGRILNRFSNDVDEVDSRLPYLLETTFRNSFQVLVSVALTAILFPWFIVAVVPLSALFYLGYQIFRKFCREIKRLDMINRSVMLSNVTNTIQGLSTLHAYRKHEETVQKFYETLDRNTLTFYVYHASQRWFACRLDIIAILLSTITAVIIVFAKGKVPAATAGVALSFILKITGMFQYTCRLAADSEARFTSVERMLHYITDTEKEAPFDIPDKKPKEAWPDRGQITFTDVVLRYRPGLPSVLKGISFSIMPKEKIGIVGRTGAGKSSLGIALFRLVEIESGTVEVDGVDISDIGLTDLRSKLSTIPQDPVLFVGTVRYNLDPFCRHSDSKLWEVLEKAHIKDMVSNLPNKLESSVIEGGSNFSVGERQLICMARALLRNSKILLLDEATASIDPDTDSKIQTTIRESFKECTVLTIAHRINTVLESDRIMVMDDGKVIEFDAPDVLVASPCTAFAKLLASTKT